MKKQEYAIVDIETTGGNATHSRITEIAIVIHDGEKVIDRWESLVNPQKHTPQAIFALTGISNEMVERAPVFDLISDKVFEMLSDRIFVAHNVNFDYSFVRHELEVAGLKWSAKKLCTVRAARKIKPGLPSYSLGKLCKSLDISLKNAHRAAGDANATTILFSRLLEWDTAGEMSKMIKVTAQDQRLPPNLPPEDFEKLPQQAGVYYFYNEFKKVIYIGKAVNLKKRVASHFTGHKITPQRQHFLRDIHAISFEVCATELMALLLEGSEIKKLWPTYNKALKHFEAKFGLFEYEARNGYHYLAIGKLSKNQSCIEAFNSIFDGITKLRELAETFEIDSRFCIYGTPTQPELPFETVKTAFPDVAVHNDKVATALEYYLNNRPSFVVIDKGRTADERSCILVEKGHFYGMGYIPDEVAITELEEVKTHLTRYTSNHYFMQVIYSFAQKQPNKIRLSQAHLQ